VTVLTGFKNLAGLGGNVSRLSLVKLLITEKCTGKKYVSHNYRRKNYDQKT